MCHLSLGIEFAGGWFLPPMAGRNAGSRSANQNLSNSGDVAYVLMDLQIFTLNQTTVTGGQWERKHGTLPWKRHLTWSKIIQHHPYYYIYIFIIIHIIYNTIFKWYWTSYNTTLYVHLYIYCIRNIAKYYSWNTVQQFHLTCCIILHFPFPTLPCFNLCDPNLSNIWHFYNILYSLTRDII